MSAENIRVPEGNTLLWLLPEQINRDEAVNVRPDYDPEKEIEVIEELAASIEAVGQILPIRVRRVGAEHHLIAGMRRVGAIEFINAKKSSREEPLRVLAVEGEDIGDNEAFQMAMIENLHRKDPTPIQFAKNIKTIRERMNWEGTKNTQKVASFLKVSPATVIQYEKFLKLSPELQARIASGEIKRDYAFELLNVKPEKREEVEATAASMAEEDAQAAPEGGKGVRMRQRGKRGPKTGKPQPTATHLRRATRQHEAAIKVRPVGREEILEFWVKVQKPEFGHPSGDVHIFARSFLMWAKGGLTEKTLMGHFASMVQKANKGKAEKPQKDEARAARAGKKKPRQKK